MTFADCSIKDLNHLLRCSVSDIRAFVFVYRWNSPSVLEDLNSELVELKTIIELLLAKQQHDGAIDSLRRLHKSLNDAQLKGFVQDRIAFLIKAISIVEGLLILNLVPY